MEILKRLDLPTTLTKADELQRVDERESGFNRALRGDFGAYLQKERYCFVAKHPLSGALGQVQFNFVDPVDGQVSDNKAPMPDDAAIMARHIKETAYFLRADLVGICELPPYAIYSRSLGVRYEESYEKALPFDESVNGMIRPKTIDATVMLMEAAIDEDVHLNISVNNRAGGNAPAIARIVSNRFLESVNRGRK